MRQVHNDIYNELQNQYLETRDNKILGDMYLIASEVARNYIQKYKRGKNLNLDVDGLSHDSATYCIEKYLDRENFKIENISSYVYFGFLKAMFKDKNYDKEFSLEALSNEEIEEMKQNSFFN
jgi:hypothetical protein